MRTVKKNRIRSLAMAGLVSVSTVSVWPCAQAETIADSYFTYADVVAVEPSYSRLTVSEPVEHCSVAAGSYEAPYYAHDRSHFYQDRAYRGAPYQDYADHDHGHPVTTIVGGVIGGLIGNQFGGGRGKKALTIAGTVVGASIASQAVRHPVRPTYDYREVPPARRCITVTETREHTVLDGYDVTYLYHGQQFTKRVAEHPGERIRIRVDVTPA